jgi:thiamine-phosphate pyrophosphorylase
MKRRQTRTPRQWLLADARNAAGLWETLPKLPRGSGVLVLHHNLGRGERARLLAKLRRVARRLGLTIVDEMPDSVARVHDMRELRRARDAQLLFVSPMFPTRSHPDWRPLPRMRAATLARLAKVPVIALGGMNERRFRRVEPLGFAGWAGLDAWSAGA